MKTFYGEYLGDNLTQHLANISKGLDGVCDPNALWDKIKNCREFFLSHSDWTQTLDVALTFEEKTAWQIYRQSLRDIPQNYANPEDTIFPTPPSEA